MRKIFSTLLLVLMGIIFFASAQAAVEGDYVWNGYTLTIHEINEKPMFAPAGMPEDHRAIGIEFKVPSEVMDSEDLGAMLYNQARLMDAEGNFYAPGAATSQSTASVLTLYVGIPKDGKIEDMTLEFVEDAGIPAEYVGDWKGGANGIDLSFTIREDGSGQYSFAQGTYSESYEMTLTATSESFSVDIPADNKSKIATCEGTYAYADGMLTLYVTTIFIGGYEMSYSIPCVRVE